MAFPCILMRQSFNLEATLKTLRTHNILSLSQPQRSGSCLHLFIISQPVRFLETNVCDPLVVVKFIAAQSYASAFNISVDLAERALQHPIAVLKARIINSTGLLLSSPEDVLSPLEKMLILAWSSKELRSPNYDPFVLSHWDLRPPNILIDPYHNIKG